VVTRHTTKRQRHFICLDAVRVIIRISLAAALTCCSGTTVTAAADLYRAQAIVTGQGEANRIIGFASSLEDVLIKYHRRAEPCGRPSIGSIQIERERFRQGI
jgi:hypothetical protein